MRPGFTGCFLVGLAGLIGTAPASLIDSLLVDTPFCLISARGSPWSGSAWLASRGGESAAIPMMLVSWHWLWHEGAAVSLVTAEGRGKLRLGVTGVRVDLPPFLVDLSALPLPATLAGSSPLGRLHGISGRFDCSYRLACQGQVALQIENLSLRLFPADRLGDVAVIIDSSEQSQSARLTADGKSALRGEVVAQRQNGRMTITSNVGTTGSASPELTRALASLKADGMSTLSLGRRWLDGASAPP